MSCLCEHMNATANPGTGYETTRGVSHIAIGGTGVRLNTDPSQQGPGQAPVNNVTRSLQAVAYLHSHPVRDALALRTDPAANLTNQTDVTENTRAANESIEVVRELQVFAGATAAHSASYHPSRYTASLPIAPTRNDSTPQRQHRNRRRYRFSDDSSQSVGRLVIHFVSKVGRTGLDEMKP